MNTKAYRNERQFIAHIHFTISLYTLVPFYVRAKLLSDQISIYYRPKRTFAQTVLEMIYVIYAL